MPTGARCAYTPRRGELYVGVTGALHRYKNGVWKKIPVVVGDPYHAVVSIAEHSIYGIYAIVHSGNPLSEFRLYRLLNDQMVLLDKTPFTFEWKPKFGVSSIFFINNSVITIGKGVTENRLLDDERIDTNAWKRTLAFSTDTESGGIGNGYIHHEKHMFAVGTQSFIYHYNGTDWAQLTNDKQPNLTWYSAVWADSGVVVVCDYDYGKIYRGF